MCVNACGMCLLSQGRVSMRMMCVLISLLHQISTMFPVYRTELFAITVSDMYRYPTCADDLKVPLVWRWTERLWTWNIQSLTRAPHPLSQQGSHGGSPCQHLCSRYLFLYPSKWHTGMPRQPQMSDLALKSQRYPYLEWYRPHCRPRVLLVPRRTHQTRRCWPRRRPWLPQL